MKISTCTIVALVSLSASVIVDARVGRVKSGIRGTVGRILKEDKEKRYDDDDDQETKEVAEAAEADLPLTEVVGNNGVFDTFPLLLCQGECDNDDECAEGLVCFQRGRNEPIPGCAPGAGFESRADFCIMMPTEEDVGSDEISVAPTSEETMEEDESAITEVPMVACTMEMRFCPDGVTPMERGPNCEWIDTMCPDVEETAPVRPCTTEMRYCDDGVTPMEQGPDCEWIDTMCLDNNETTAAVACTLEMRFCPDGSPMDRDPATCRWMEETCSASTAPTEIEEDDFVEAKENDEMPMLEIVGQDGKGAFPLGLCQGDCDNDDECQEGLVCLERNPGDPVPGCAGDNLDSTTDFCVAAETEVPEELAAEGTVVPSVLETFVGTAVGSEFELIDMEDMAVEDDKDGEQDKDQEEDKDQEQENKDVDVQEEEDKDQDKDEEEDKEADDEES